MSNKTEITTADDLLKDYLYKPGIPFSPEIEQNYGAITTAMIEFAKVHVTEALNTAAHFGRLREDAFGPEDIKNCYSLDKIK